MRTRARAGLLLGLLGIQILGFGLGTARADSLPGPFLPFNGWWVHPTAGTLGIQWDGSFIRIDRDGDGVTESSFLRPSGATGIPDAAIGSLRLSPSRTIVYAFGGDCPPNGTLVYFYRVPSGTSENRLEPIRTGLCIPNGIDRHPGFYDTGLCDSPDGVRLECQGRLGVSPQRVALFVTPAAEFGFVNLVWVDLETGTVSGPNFDFASGLGFVHVAPSGTHAFVQHDLGAPGETDYRLVDLCPGSLGTVINPGGFPIADESEVLAAEVTAAGGGTITVEVRTGTSVRTSFELTDCLDVAGACCFESGSCLDTITAEQCTNGTFLGPDTACGECPAPSVEEACCFPEGFPVCEILEASACTDQGGVPQPGERFCSQVECPAPDPVLDLTGPTSARIGDEVTYTFDFTNEGDLLAHDVEIQVSLPFGTTFLGATGGGDDQGGFVQWVLGDLAPGAGGSVSFSFRFECGSSFVSLQGLISHEPPGGARTSIASPQISYTVEPLATGPVQVELATVPAADPLAPGDEVTHTVTLTNTNAVPVEEIRLGSSGTGSAMGIAFGEVTAFDRVLDAGGGTPDTSSGRFEWTGTLGAGASATIAFVTQVDACIPAGVETTELNFGVPVAVFDRCDNELGASDAPEAFALLEVVETQVAAANLAPAQTLDAPALDIDVQLARPGENVRVEVRLRSGVGEALPGASFGLELSGFTLTGPPTEPGTGFDAAANRVTWFGDVPANGALPVASFEGVAAACRADFELTGSTGTGCTDIRARSVMAAVPEPPAAPWIAAMVSRPHPFQPFAFEDHVMRVDPNLPGVLETVLCIPTEFVTGIDGTPNGDIWVGWLPTFRFNPAALELEVVDLAELTAAGLSSLADVAVDPVDESVYFVGSTPLNGGSAAFVARRDPGTGVIAPYVQDETLDSIEDAAVDALGRIAAAARRFGQNRLVRIDPGTPPVVSPFDAPDVGSPADVTMDRDGSFVTIDGASFPPALRDVDPDTQDVEVVVADLGAAFPDAFGWGQVLVDDAGAIYVAPTQPGLGVVRRTPEAMAETLIPIASFGAGQIQDMAMVSLPVPEPDALALLAALFFLAGGGALRRTLRPRQQRGS